ncbi:Arylsulfatase precursor [Pseudobythopirellula maris]|uniref:Arylsulfatase n=1 Tax=Pseudobythopirellula maris TaxID=2527991 RepID=A0A5C5ZU51_9BACT|nr:sulfatase-like hydrolase/transferase [Pseudobythopirellula maris]TWT91104.1 Arylsulfatase precursor [Pseudobythopirellula maris]
MTPRIFRSLCLASAAALVVLVARIAAAQPAPPNVIVILADDQSWNGTSVRMDPDIPGSASDFYQTPSVAALASQGMRFSDAYSAAAVCSPTRAALLTGMSPAQAYMTDIIRPNMETRDFSSSPLKPVEWRRLDATLETLPRRVEAADSRYVTGHIGKWHLSPDDPLQMGYDIGFDPVRAGGVGANDPGSVFAKTEAAKQFLDDRTAADEPFFLQLSHFAVHTPIEGQPEVIEKYENLPPGTVHNKNRYAAFTEALDTGVGDLLDHLDTLGLSENTYVIYASDNGARDVNSNNDPLSGTKAHLLEGGIRTPLIIRGPGITPGTVSRVPVSTTDLYSTVSDLVGNATPLSEQIEGASLRPLFENDGELPAGMEYLERQHAEGGALYFHNPHNAANGGNYRIRPTSAVRVDDYKLLRFHGENGNPDRDYLFNLADTLTETEDNGSTDLAAAMPEKTAELGQMLDNWIESTDASLPYAVEKPVDLTWRADEIGQRDRVWSSAEDIKHRWRESWEVIEESPAPATEAIATHLPGAPKQAFSFDGQSRFGRRFFDVSDQRERSPNTRYPTGEADFDRSVAFELLVRVDDLNGEQVLFESGTTSHGLSLTLGDDDSDGVHDELRMRVLSDFGESLSVTGDIDDFASPTEDFVQLTAVYNDDPTGRYLELFANGKSIGRADGVAGDGTVDDRGSLLWDQYDPGFAIATLGGERPELVGGNSGSGPLPFTQGWLRGEIASFRYLNHAIDSQAVQSSYAALLSDPGFGVVSASGDALIPGDRSVSVATGDLEMDGAVRVIHERVDRLDSSLTLDIAAVAGESAIASDSADPSSVVLESGTVYSSYLFHFDSETDESGGVEQLSGSVSFDTEILGVLYKETTLDGVELAMGVAGEFELGDRSLELNGLGVFEFSEDLMTLSFDLAVDSSLLTQFRVLTAASIFVEGDYNGDGQVDMADYDEWVNQFGVEGDSLADGNGDGRVNAADFTVWRDNYHPVSQQSVPEPAALCLFSVSLGGLGLRRQRR